MIAPALATLLRPADVLLVGRTGGISDAIRRVTKSRFSHTALLAQSHGAWIVIEATTDVNGCAARKLEVITDDPTVETLVLRRIFGGITMFQDAVVQAMWLQTGLPYSQRVNLEILLGLPVRHADGINCAAAINEAYFHGLGVYLTDPALPTPEAIAQSPRLVEVWARP